MTVALISVAVLLSPPPKGGKLLIYSPILMLAESAQTLQVTVLCPVPKAVVHNECGLPMCAVAGFEPRTVACHAKERSQRLRELGHGDTRLWAKKQGHHHNCDQAARRPHMVCPICGRIVTTPLFLGTRELG